MGEVNELIFFFFLQDKISNLMLSKYMCGKLPLIYLNPDLTPSYKHFYLYHILSTN